MAKVVFLFSTLCTILLFVATCVYSIQSSNMGKKLVELEKENQTMTYKKKVLKQEIADIQSLRVAQLRADELGYVPVQTTHFVQVGTHVALR